MSDSGVPSAPPSEAPSFDFAGAYRATLQGRVRFQARPRVSVKAQAVVLGTLISCADRSGLVTAEFAPSITDLCAWLDLDEREARGALQALHDQELIRITETPGRVNTYEVRYPFAGMAERLPKARSRPRPRLVTPYHTAGGDHMAGGHTGSTPLPIGRGIERDPPAVCQGVGGGPPANGQVVHGQPPTNRQGVPPTNGQGGGPGSSGSTSGSTIFSGGRGEASQDPPAPVATGVPLSPTTPPPPPSGSVQGEAAGAPPDPAQDQDRLNVARHFLSTDEHGWRIWEVLVRSPALREAEDRDLSVQPGSLARQASGIAGKVMSGTSVELGIKAAGDVARDLDAERAAAGNTWQPPTMLAVSKTLSRFFGSDVKGRRGGHGPGVSSPAWTAGGGNGGGRMRVPHDATGTYGGDAAAAATAGKLAGLANAQGQRGTK